MREPSESLAYLIRTVHHALRTRLEDVLHPHGLTLPQLAVLSALEQTPGLSNAELARAAFVSPQAMNQSLSALERSRLVKRTPDSINARVLRTALTPTGVRKLFQVGRAVDRVEMAIRRALTSREQRMMRDLLARTATALAGGHRR